MTVSPGMILPVTTEPDQTVWRSITAATDPQPASAPAEPEMPDPDLVDLPPPETGWAAPDNEPGFLDVASAAYARDTVATDVWNYRQNLRRELALQMARKLPPEVQATLYDPMRRAPETEWDDLPALVIDAAAKVASASPEAAADWAGYPLTIEAFDGQIDQRRKREYDEAQAILDQPGGGVAEFTGSAARAINDPINLALMPFGLEGGALRIIAGEAALGAAGEALSLPREYAVAQELDLPEPDAASRIGMGALLGGAIPAAVIGGGKAIGALSRGQSAIEWGRAKLEGRAAARAAMPGGTDPVDFYMGVDAAEAEMRGQQTVAEAMGRNTQPGTLGAIIGQPPKFDYSAAGNASPRSNRVGYVFGKLLEKGYPPHVAAALVGNSMQESGPSINTKAVGDNGNAFGMGQWNGPRRHAYLAFAAKRGVDPGDLDTQIEFLDYEMKGPERAAYEKIMATSDAISAAEVASREFWRPGTPYIERRRAFADAVMRQYDQGQVPKWDGATTIPEGATTYTGTSRGYTGTGQVMAGDEFRIDVQYEVVDLSSLTRASGDLQPRDRSRVSSDAWIADTAARLDPAQLMPSPTADRGTPIVGSDNVIESGNGRFGAIARAYEQHPDRAAAYKSQIEAAGFAIPDGVEQPVLIARRTSDLSPDQRVQFAVAAQDSGVAAMTPTEVARASSRAMTPNALSQLDLTKPLNDAANGGFVRTVLSGLARSARNAMFDASGLLNASGLRQLREALFARAWPDPDILARFTETDAGELRSLMDALDRSAPAWAALKADIEAGAVSPDMDISGYVLDAMRLIGAARDLAAASKMPVAKAVADLLDEVDLIDGAIAPLTAALVKKFWKGGKAASADDVAAFLTRYAEDARKAGATGGMFDAPGPRDVLAAIDKSFADLPEELGNVRGFARPVAQIDAEAADLTEKAAFDPGEGWDSGAASDAATEADAAIRAEIEPPAAPVKPDMRAVLDAQAKAADLRANPPPTARAEVAALGPDFAAMEIEMPDGTSVRVSEVLDDLDTDEGFDAYIQSCAIIPGSAA